MAFQNKLDEDLNLNVTLKNKREVEDATEYITRLIQDSAWAATPEATPKEWTNSYPRNIKERIAQNRRLRRVWQLSRNPIDKTNYNRITRELKKLIYDYNNSIVEQNLSYLTNTKSTDYSLWKVTKRLKRPQQQNPPIKKPNGEWAKYNADKAETFANHLAGVFTPVPTQQDNEDIL